MAEGEAHRPAGPAETALTFVAHFEERSLTGHCELQLDAEDEVALDIHQCIHVKEVTSQGCRLNFQAEDSALTVKLDRAKLASLQIDFVVTPGSPALLWLEDGQLVVAQEHPGWARALFPSIRDLRSRYSLSIWVPEGMAVAAAGAQLKDPGGNLDGYRHFAFRIDQPVLSHSVAFVMGDLQQHPGGLATLLGQGESLQPQQIQNTSRAPRSPCFLFA
ncbi:unnamed protein product [Effrenium voratum]|nr:unnamed protein product [Effrenium voratum]